MRKYPVNFLHFLESYLLCMKSEDARIVANAKQGLKLMEKHELFREFQQTLRMELKHYFVDNDGVCYIRCRCKGKRRV